MKRHQHNKQVEKHNDNMFDVKNQQLFPSKKQHEDLKAFIHKLFTNYETTIKSSNFGKEWDAHYTYIFTLCLIKRETGGIIKARPMIADLMNDIDDETENNIVLVKTSVNIGAKKFLEMSYSFYRKIEILSKIFGYLEHAKAFHQLLSISYVPLMFKLFPRWCFAFKQEFKQAIFYLFSNSYTCLFLQDKEAMVKLFESDVWTTNFLKNLSNFNKVFQCCEILCCCGVYPKEIIDVVTFHLMSLF